MKFSKIIGKIDPALVKVAEEKLSNVFLELGTRYTNKHVGSGMGGDPLIFGLMYPVQHVCTLNMPTAATDGKRYYWNPKFVIKQSKIGLRIVCTHEAWHAIYTHPTRRGFRNPKLWNIAVDYIVNGTCMDDFKSRDMPAAENFEKHLGKFMTLPQYAELLKNPWGKIKGFEDLKPEDAMDSNIKFPLPSEDRDLTEQEQKNLENKVKKLKFYYADPDLDPDMKKPEKIYDMLYNLLPKCPKCGRIGIYQKPGKKNNQNAGSNNQDGSSNEKEEGSEKEPGNGNESNGGTEKQPGNGNEPGQKDSEGNGNGSYSNHEHGGDQPCDCPGDQNDQSQNPSDGKGCCSGCGDGIDIFGLGGTVDDHMDTTESEEKLAKRISEAMNAASKMAGHIPASLEEELGKLIAPKITWQDIIRTRLLKARQGNGKNDYTRFRTRPMSLGLLMPKKKSYYAHFGCLLDTSGSMSKDDMAFGLSQLCALDERSEGTIVPADASIYWDKATKIKKATADEVNKVKVVGRGGTKFSEFFTDYEKNIGICDFLIVITDGWLLDQDVAEMKNPGIDVIWLVTSGSNFNAPFGRCFDLNA